MWRIALRAAQCAGTQQYQLSPKNLLIPPAARGLRQWAVQPHSEVYRRALGGCRLGGHNPRPLTGTQGPTSWCVQLLLMQLSVKIVRRRGDPRGAPLGALSEGAAPPGEAEAVAGALQDGRRDSTGILRACVVLRLTGCRLFFYTLEGDVYIYKGLRKGSSFDGEVAWRQRV